MRIPTRSIVTACALMGALLAAGCAGTGVKQTRAGELVLLQAAGERGPDPFTASTDTGSVRAESPRGTARVQPGDVEAPLRATRSLSGATPGLYRGSPRVAGCDVERHVRYLTADAAKADAFARAADVSRAALPGYLRGLTPVVLGADTRVTNHAYRDGRASRYQAVLQAGTAVLVDDRGMPRVRCACGNPLKPPAPTRGGAGARGTPWAGYRPNQVVVVTPAPRAVPSITIVDAATRTWIERRVGPDVRRDRVVPPPVGAATSPAPPDPADEAAPPVTGRPSPGESRPSATPGRTGAAPSPSGPAAPDARAEPPVAATGLADRDAPTAAAEPPVLDPALDLSRAPSPGTSGGTVPPGIPDVPADGDPTLDAPPTTAAAPATPGTTASGITTPAPPGTAPAPTPDNPATTPDASSGSAPVGPAGRAGA
ncbi:DUF6777 domain-containing protein [Streptomyces tricolor]